MSASTIKTGTAVVNGAELYYEVKGAGSPLLLLHAGVADSRMWDAQFTRLAAHYRVIRFDMRGFGRSSMPPGAFSNIADVGELLDALGIKQSVHLLGISFGSLIALDFALAYPQRARSLIMAAPSVSGATPSDRIRQFWQAEEEAAERGDLAGATELNLQMWVDGPHRQPDQVDAAVRQQVGEMQFAIFQKDIPDDVESIDLEPPANGRLSEVAVPVLVIVGELDLPEKVALAARLEATIPDCRQLVIPHGAHMINMEQPAVFNQHVLSFLAKRDEA